MTHQSLNFCCSIFYRRKFASATNDVNEIKKHNGTLIATATLHYKN